MMPFTITCDEPGCNQMAARHTCREHSQPVNKTITVGPDEKIDLASGDFAFILATGRLTVFTGTVTINYDGETTVITVGTSIVRAGSRVIAHDDSRASVVTVGNAADPQTPEGK